MDRERCIPYSERVQRGCECCEDATHNGWACPHESCPYTEMDSYTTYTEFLRSTGGDTAFSCVRKTKTYSPEKQQAMEVTVVCQQCGCEYHRTNPLQKYCSDACKQAAHRQAKKEKAKRMEGYTDTAVCVVCGKTFHKTSGFDKWFCSDDCREERTRQRKRERRKRRKKQDAETKSE